MWANDWVPNSPNRQATRFNRLAASMKTSAQKPEDGQATSVSVVSIRHRRAGLLKADVLET